MYVIGEIPWEFILNGADVYSPLFSNDVGLTNKARYHRIANTSYLKSMDVSELTNSMHLIIDNFLNKYIFDSYIECALKSEKRINIKFCNKRIEWISNQLDKIHQYERLFIDNKVFSIGIVEASSDVSQSDWELLVYYMTSVFDTLVQKYPSLGNFKLYDDSISNTARILTFECIRQVTYDKHSDYTTKIISNNSSVVYAYRSIEDSQLIPGFNDGLGRKCNLFTDKYVRLFNMLDKMNIQEVIDVYKEINYKVKKYAKEISCDDDTSDLVCGEYDFILAYDIKISNRIVELITKDDIDKIDELFCLINSTALEIKSSISGVGVLHDSSTMLLIYRSQILKDKNLIGSKIKEVIINEESY